MKRCIAILLSAILFISCTTTIKSVVDKDAIKHPYKNPLMVIPFEKGITLKFCDKLKERLEFYIKTDSTKVEIFLSEQKKKELALNNKSEIDEKINNAIQADNKDLIVIFKPTHYVFSNGSITSVTYEIAAIDVTTKKEVWKSELTSGGSFGIATLADKSAKLIYERLSGEGVL